MRAEKQLLLDEIEGKMGESTGFIVVSYQQLKAPTIREFRDKISESGGDFEVIRKRVFIKAATKKGLPIDLSELTGHIGIIFTKEDAGPSAKIALSYEEKEGEPVKILRGMIEGKLCSSDDVKAFATLPSLEVLRSMFV